MLRPRREAGRTPSRPPLDTEVCVAISATLAHTEMSAHWAELIEQAFALSPNGAKKDKETKRFKRVLRSSTACEILKIFWRESPEISAELLASCGEPKSFDDGVCVHAAAVKLSERPDKVASMNSQVKTIAHAAEYFGLLEFKPRLPKVQLIGTPRLHALMTTLGLCIDHTLRNYGGAGANPSYGD
jgi:hypothetical protein